MPVLLQINSVANRGSTGRIAESIGLFAEQHGWNSYIGYGRQSNESSLKKVKIGSQASVITHALQTLIFDQHGFGSRNATKKFLARLEGIQPDIIHLHNIHGYYLNYPALFQYIEQHNIPIVWTLHDCWAFTGHCTHFSDIDCGKWKTECYDCPKKGNYPRSIWKDASQENFRLKKSLFTQVSNLNLITVSDWLQGLVKQSFLSTTSVQTIHNGVDTEIFNPKADISVKHIVDYSLDGKFVMVAASTSWARQKGFEDYCTLSEYLAPDEVIVLIGLPPEKMRNLPEQVIGLPRTESIQELAAWYAAADIVLNLSYLETFGLTTVEGFACGTPSIVYNATASPELLQGDRLGYIVAPGKIEEVVSAKNKIKRNTKAYYSAHCRSAALARFDQKKQLFRYLKVYEEMLNN